MEERAAIRERLYRRFVADEVASALRHRVVNKLAGVGALSFHLKRQLAAVDLPPAAAGVFPLLDAEVGEATTTLGQRFLGPPPAGAPVVAVTAAVGETLRTLGPRRPGVELVGPAVGPATVAVDPGELDLAVACLVENACEAATSLVRVICRTAPDSDGRPWVTIEVADDGPGLPSEARPRVREAFFTTKADRLGLGLNVAARVAERWRGRLEIDHDAATGLRVRLLLPLGPA